jgi:hypothetical protein
VKDREIRISNLSQLNDPFEATPWINPPNKESILQKFSDPTFLETATEFLLDKGLIQKASDTAPYLQEKREEFATNLLDQASKNPIFTDPKRIQDEFSGEFGCTSFSRVPSEILMWSHYAEKHQGFVLGFSNLIFGEEYPREVIYSSHRIEYSDLFHSATRDYLFFKILRTKSLKWSYEEELRSVLPWSICYQKKDGYFYHSFPATELKCIIFGSRCPAKFKSELIHEMETNYPHAKIYEVGINSYRYRLDLYELTRKEN